MKDDPDGYSTREGEECQRVNVPWRSFKETPVSPTRQGWTTFDLN